MTQDEIIRKNLDLHAEWMKYVFEHPDVLDRIPKGAVLVILPEDERYDPPSSSNLAFSLPVFFL